MQQIDNSAFQEFLKPGVGAFFPLLQSTHIIVVLVALFRGGREEIMPVWQCCANLPRVSMRMNGPLRNYKTN